MNQLTPEKKEERSEEKKDERSETERRASHEVAGTFGPLNARESETERRASPEVAVIDPRNGGDNSLVDKGKHMEYLSFSFSKFPLEEKNICVCVVTDRESSSEIKPLLNYLQLIFPSDSASIMNKVAEKPNKNMILKCDELFTDWTDNISIKKIFDRYNDFHILGIGSWGKIPKVLIANADVLIFDNEKDINEYLSKNHHLRLNGFDFVLHYLVVDKRGKDCDMRFIQRATLDRYTISEKEITIPSVFM